MSKKPTRMYTPLGDNTSESTLVPKKDRVPGTVELRAPSIWLLPKGPDPTKLPCLDVMINEDYTASALISTATTTDLISEKLVDQIGAKKIPLSYPCVCDLIAPAGVPIKYLVDLQFKANGITFQRKCYVFPDLRVDIIFGAKFVVDFPPPITDFNTRKFNGLPMYNP